MAEVSSAAHPWTADRTRAQFRAIAQLRWRIFRNGLRRKGGVGDLLANLVMVPIFLLFLVGPSVGAGFVGYFAFTQNHPEFLSFALWGIFTLSQIASIQLGQPNTTFDPTQLIRFPLNFRGYAAIRTFFGLLSPANIVGTLMSFSVALGVSVAIPGLALYAFTALAAFALANIFFTRMLFSWVDRWLSTRRAREVFTAFIFIFSIGIQFLNATFNPGFQHGRAGHALVAARIARVEHSYQLVQPVLNVLPPGLTANALLAVHRGGTSAWIAGVLGTLAFAVAFFAIFAMRLYKEFRGENLSEVANAVSTPAAATHGARQTHTASATTSAEPARFAPPPTVAAVFHKEFLTLRRNSGMFYGIIAPLAMVIIFAGRLAAHTPPSILFPSAVAYTMLGIAPLCYNSLGLEAAGIQFYFLAPVRMRDVFFAKNLMVCALATLEVLGVFGVMVFVSKAPSPMMALSVVLWAAFAMFSSMALGNRRSVTAPKKVDPTKPAGKQASPASALLSVLLLLACTGLGAGILYLASRFGIPWVLPPTAATLAVLGFFAYRASLNATDRLLAENRDTLSEILCKAG